MINELGGGSRLRLECDGHRGIDLDDGRDCVEDLGSKFSVISILTIMIC